MFLDGDTTRYDQTGFRTASETASVPDMWCTGAVIDGSHDGVARSAPGLTATISVSGPDQLLTFDAGQHAGAAASSWPTPLLVGHVLTIGNPADLLDNGSYEILEIVSGGAPVIVRLNRVTAWSTAGAGIVWDRSDPVLTPADDMLVRLSNNFPLVDASVIDRKLALAATVMNGPGRGLSRRPLALYSSVLLNATLDFYVKDDSDPVILPRWIRSAPYGAEQLGQRASDNVNFRLSPFYADLPSKTVMIQPWQTLGLGVDSEVVDGGALNGGDGLMPLKVSAPATTDNEGLFGPVSGANPESFLPLHEDVVGVRVSDGVVVNTYLGFDLPVRTTDTTRWSEGLNFFLPERVTTGTSAFINTAFVWTNFEGNGASTFLSFATLDQAGAAIPFGEQSTAHYVNSYMFSGMRHTSFTVDGGTTVRGLELPPYFGPGRVWAIYERGDYISNGSNYDAATRVQNSSSTTNLLITTEERDTLWLCIDSTGDGDGTFIIPEKLISGYDPTTEYIIECSPFGFDRGFFTTNFRLIPVSNPPLGTAYAAGDFESFPTLLIPQPVEVGAAARVRYTTAPYQGDVNGTQLGFQDRGQRHGPVLADWVDGIVSDPVDPDSASLLSNPTHFEVLAGVGFITNLGTGLLSGRNQNGAEPNTFFGMMTGKEELGPDVLVSTGDPAPRVNSSSWTFAVDPPTTGETDTVSIANLSVGALVGLTNHLPMGIFMRDHSFVGGLLSPSEITLQTGELTPDIALNASPLHIVPLTWSYQLGNFMSAGKAVPEGEIFPEDALDQQLYQYMPNLRIGDMLTLVDGHSDPSDILNDGQFRTNRGKGMFISRGLTPGAPVEATLSIPAIHNRSDTAQNPFLSGVAFLVRSLPEKVSAREFHHGDELQLVVMTTTQFVAKTDNRTIPVAVASDNRDSMFFTSVFGGVTGVGEGLSAADRYRLTGHPLVKGHRLTVPDLAAIRLMPAGNFPYNLINQGV